MGQLEEMTLFVRVAEAGSISKAAEQLGIAKSAVSRRLVELETRLGNQLLIRTTRNSKLTEQGELFHQRALSILQDVDELNEETKNTKQAQLKGDMRISAPTEFGALHMPDILERFAKQHPELTIHVNFTNRKVNLIEEGFELAIRIAQLKDSSLHARTLCKINHVIAASPEYLAQNGTPQIPEDLLQHKFLAYELASFNTTLMLDSNGKNHSIQPEAMLKANSGFFLKDMAIRGMGLISLPTFIVYGAIKDGRLKPVLTEYQLPSMHLNVVYPNTRFTSAKVRTFIDFLVTHIGEQPIWDRPTGNVIMAKTT